MECPKCGSIVFYQPEYGLDEGRIDQLYCPICGWRTDEIMERNKKMGVVVRISDVPTYDIPTYIGSRR